MAHIYPGEHNLVINGTIFSEIQYFRDNSLENNQETFFFGELVDLKNAAV